MTIIIMGLGIIGGSIAKAVKKYTDHTVLGMNRSPAPLQKALACGAIDGIADQKTLAGADMVILGVYPEAAVAFIQKNGAFLKKGCIVMDTSGIKMTVCPQLTALSQQYGFTFVGFHPMAGKEKNGFDVSEADLFVGASALLLPCQAPQTAVDTAAALMKKLRFGQIVLTTPEEHDRMIAFTSQLPHVLACAYVFSPRCPHHKGFSAGSYRDVSRVANINAALWSELFIENREPLAEEIQTLIDHLTLLRQDILSGDREALTQQLQRAKEIKEALGE